MFQGWADHTLRAAIQEQRAAAAHVATDSLAKILEPVPLVSKGLSKRNAQTGEIEEGADQNQIAQLLMPGGVMALMFMLILIGAPPMMQGVVEEKMQRIAEVLLGSARPFQIMMGKLLGLVAVSLTLSIIYLSGAYWTASRFEYTQYLSAYVLSWFFVYQVLAVLMFGSLFIAVGAACTEARETQTMLWPVMLLIMLPMFVWINVVQEPTSSFATGISLFPFSTPMLMIARQAAFPAVPLWQPITGVALMLITTLLCVYAAGRIFRVGILMQGKGANFGEMLKWVFRG
jgi:ABC-type Na+ efflux pump permease subunit